MTLLEIIKTKNGLAFLGNNTNLIPVHSQRLTHEIPQFLPEVNYGETEFSFKNYVRPMPKTFHPSFQNLVSDLVQKSANFQREMADILNGKVLDFDGDFFAINKEGEISYMPYNKVQKVIGIQYAKTGRQKLTIHKFIAKVFKSNERFTEQHLKDFAEYMKSISLMTLRIEFLKGEDIGKSYAEVSHAGWARASCMANKPNYPAKKFTIYAENCELGIVKSGDEIVGRFLRWTSEDGEHYEDSMYYKTGSVKTWYDQRCQRENILRYGSSGGKKLKFITKRPLKDYKDDERPGYFDGVSFSEKEATATNRY